MELDGCLAAVEKPRMPEIPKPLLRWCLPGLHHHTFKVRRLWKNRQRALCTSESPAHVLSHLRSFPSTRFQVQLTGTCFQCPGTLGDGCVIGRFGEPPFVLVLFWLVVSAVQAMESVDRALTLLTTAAAIANTFAQACNAPRVWSSQMIPVCFA